MVRRNFGNQASRVHPSEIERYCFRAQRTERMTSVGLVLVFSLRASEAEKQLMEVTKYVSPEFHYFQPYCSPLLKCICIMSLRDFYGPFCS